MSTAAQNSPQYIRYRDIALQRAKEYNKKNKEKIKEYKKKQIQKLKSRRRKKKWLRDVENDLIDRVKKNKTK